VRQVTKLLNLLFSSDRLDRANNLLKIRTNYLFYNHHPARAETISLDSFLAQLEHTNSALFHLLAPRGEASQAVESVRGMFKTLLSKENLLPLPSFYNADHCFALLSYALTRYLKPEFALETGVGYGITSALVLSAMELDYSGKLVSIDLPSLSDPNGFYTGAVVSKQWKDRWTLHLGSSRRFLPKIVSNNTRIGLFISDSANVYTLQRYEFETVYPKLATGGAALFNNIGSKFQEFLRSVDGIEVDSIWQVDKPACATGLLIKK
jgi:hypothetical protein